MTKLSIITINYNNAKGLQKTMESVFRQTASEFEYIVIDGGSTDGSVDVIQRFLNDEPKKYIRQVRTHNCNFFTYWVSEPDSGVYNAMNKGIKAGRGEYCQFLNSGDWLAHDTVVEKMIANLPECNIVYGDIIKVFPNGKKILDSGSAGDITFFKLYRGTINHPSSWIRRTLFEKYGYYDEEMKIVSDWKWFMVVVGLHNEKVAYVDMAVTCFDMSGISSSNKQLEAAERNRVLEDLVPPRILLDYRRFEIDLMMLNRISRYKPVKWLVWFMERVLFKLEKWKMQ